MTSDDVIRPDEPREGASPPATFDRKRVVITGVTGTLGAALAQAYRSAGCEVVGVSHRETPLPPACHRMVRSAQASADDAERLLELDPDVLILNAARIETEVGPAGVPLVDTTREIFALNAVFPSLVVAAAGARGATRRLDLVAIGSIADGSPSCFGPAYHASKTALHSFIAGAGPIVHAAHPCVRVRLYRPGVVRGPLSWAPVLRLNARGAALRARRCRRAPEAAEVAARIVRWIEGDDWIGSDRAPLSFRALQALHAAAPDLYYRLQRLGWKRGSRFVEGHRIESGGEGAGRGVAVVARPESNA
jgi:NAD(P)-dependent dehydrogenase (short-subunit alcohol dehydrogenase family)